LQTIYDWAIEFGGHPNERGVLVAMTRVERTEGVRTLGAVLLTDNQTLIVAALKSALEAAIGALKTFRLIFPERYVIMGMDGEIDRLVGDANAVFKKYAQ
jgi:hypothetical protein